MADLALQLVTDLLTRTSEALTPRALVRAIAEAVAGAAPIDLVEVRTPMAIVHATLLASTWRSADGAAPEAGARRLVPGLAVRARGEFPELLLRDDVLAAVTQVFDGAVRRLEILGRVAAAARRAHVENRALRAEHQVSPQQPVARSGAMREVVRRAEIVARHPTTVLLVGESGTGKEVLARYLHARSPRAHRPMVQINCGALPEALVESELFGHERGAFTGAERTHVGAFERAHRGTLLLDEVGELPLSAQVKLLRALQERQVRRVGGTVQLDVDVRLIAATHRSLPAMVAAGTFREDLYYRLHVFELSVPPLRERAADLPALVQALVAELAQRLGLAAPPISRATMAALAAHRWPGNVRELANVLEAALILGDGEALVLPSELASLPARRGAPLAAAVRDTIEAALRASGGKIYGEGGAAARLGIPPGTLQSKLKKLGLDRRAYRAT